MLLNNERVYKVVFINSLCHMYCETTKPNKVLLWSLVSKYNFYYLILLLLCGDDDCILHFFLVMNASYEYSMLTNHHKNITTYFSFAIITNISGLLSSYLNVMVKLYALTLDITTFRQSWRRILLTSHRDSRRGMHRKNRM